MCGDYVLTGIHWSGTPIDLTETALDTMILFASSATSTGITNRITFLKSISEIMITDFENGELTVRIRCSLTDSKQEVKTDYIHYNYRKNY